MQALLTVENSPPFAAPARFFLTAPLFGALAGILLACDGEAVLASRWTPGALAATHLLTVGFMLQVMLGALIQVLPVVAGAHLPHPLALARAIHAGLTLGALLLAGGFLFAAPLALAGGGILLAATVLAFLAAVARALAGVASTSPTIRGLKLALGALGVVVALGAVMALGVAAGWNLPLAELVELHAGWGFAGWAGILLAALACVVVPMFQLTPGYPAAPSWRFPLVVAAALALWSLADIAGAAWLERLAQAAIALAGAAFALLTWRLQARRRRARPDTTLRYWQLGLAACLAALAMLLAAAIQPQLAEHDNWAFAFGILVVAGSFMSFIIGMLFKIVPFLAWLHLQNHGQARVAAPAMTRILGDAETRRQWAVYAGALVLLLGAVAAPAWLALPAGLAFAVANLWLFWLLGGALRRYRAHWREMSGALADQPGQNAGHTAEKAWRARTAGDAARGADCLPAAP